MKVSVDTSTVDAAASRWERRARTIARDADATLKAHGPQLVEDAAEVTPVESGKLAGAWLVTNEQKGLRLVNPLPYGRLLLSGELSARVRAKVSARIPSFQPEIVRRQTHGGS